MRNLLIFYLLTSLVKVLQSIDVEATLLYLDMSTVVNIDWHSLSYLWWYISITMYILLLVISVVQLVFSFWITSLCPIHNRNRDHCDLYLKNNARSKGFRRRRIYWWSVYIRGQMRLLEWILHNSSYVQKVLFKMSFFTLIYCPKTEVLFCDKPFNERCW